MTPTKEASFAPGAPAGASIPAAMWGLALLFFLKAAALALFVTPLWDVPDEVAHFATISELADGHGVPRPGASVVPSRLVALWNPSLVGQSVGNWVSIHPPGYHALAVPFLRVARAVTPDFEWQVRGTRLLSALCGAAALLVFFRVLREAGADRPTGLAGAAAVGFIPMYSHMSSGINHDILCALLGGLVALAFFRLIRGRSSRDAFALALALAAAGAVKATTVPLALALLPLVPVHLTGRLRGRIARGAAVAAVALSTTAAWALWSGTVPGSNASPAAGPARAPTAIALLEGLRDAPILDHTFKNFLGLIGWTGTGHGALAWFQISGPFLAVYLLLALLLLALTAAWVWDRDFGRSRESSTRAAAASWGLAAVVLVASFGWLAAGIVTAWPKLALYALLLAVPCLSISRVWRVRETPESAVFASQFMVLVFTAVYLFHIVRKLLAMGVMRGTHGRYFFIVVGFLLAALVLPAADRLSGWRRRNRLMLAVVLALFANETLFFLARVIPFYRGAGARPLP
jgi:hypothetical protein